MTRKCLFLPLLLLLPPAPPLVRGQPVGVGQVEGLGDGEGGGLRLPRYFNINHSF